MARGAFWLDFGFGLMPSARHIAELAQEAQESGDSEREQREDSERAGREDRGGEERGEGGGED